MEYGIICLLPPIIAIALALKTKQTLPSLFIAVWVGATIIKGWNPIAGFTAIISEYMIPSIASEYNAGLLVLVTMAGGFAYMLKITGAAEAICKAGYQIYQYAEKRTGYHRSQRIYLLLH